MHFTGNCTHVLAVVTSDVEPAAFCQSETATAPSVQPGHELGMVQQESWGMLYLEQCQTLEPPPAVKVRTQVHL